jgi:hypothetical protein
VGSLFVVAIAALSFAGCATFPEKVNPDECLVVIKTEFINPYNLARGRELTFKFSGDYPPSVVGQYSWDFNVVVVRESGVMLKSVDTIFQGGYRGEAWELAANMPLPYEPGRTVIADFVFVDKIEQVAEHRYTTNLGFRKITAEERDQLRQMLDSDDLFASWRK